MDHFKMHSSLYRCFLFRPVEKSLHDIRVRRVGSLLGSLTLKGPQTVRQRRAHGTMGCAKYHFSSLGEVKERGVWHATNVTCPFFTAYRSPCIDFLPCSCDVRRFLPADYRTETIPCRYLCFLNDIWQKRLRFLTRFRGISRGDFALPFTRNPEETFPCTCRHLLRFETKFAS